MRTVIKRLVKSALGKGGSNAVAAGGGFRAEILDPFLSLLKRRLGFVPRHIIGVLWLCEAAFVKNGSALLSTVRSYE